MITNGVMEFKLINCVLRSLIKRTLFFFSQKQKKIAEDVGYVDFLWSFRVKSITRLHAVFLFC